jgi:hypothetical protein
MKNSGIGAVLQHTSMRKTRLQPFGNWASSAGMHLAEAREPAVVVCQ